MTAAAGAGLDWAVAEAARRRAPLRVVHAVDDGIRSRVAVDLEGEPVSPLDDRPEFVAGREVLAAAVRRATRMLPAAWVEPRLVTGPAVVVLVAEAADAALTVVGTHALSRSEVMVPSTAEEVAEYAPGPVVVVPATSGVDGGFRHEGRVAAGLAEHAGAATATRLLEFAFAEASVHGRELALIRQDTGSGPDGVAEVIAGLRDRHPDVRWEDRPRRHHLADLLIEASRETDLMIVARRRHGLAALRNGSATRALVQRVTKPPAPSR